MSRTPRPLPLMRINPDVPSLFSFKFENFTLEGYDPHPAHRGACGGLAAVHHKIRQQKNLMLSLRNSAD